MQVIAHRGGAGLRVENTLAAFENALRLGVAGAELDVQLSRDGEVVVHHNASLNPAYCRRVDGSWIEAGQARPISELDYSALLAYDIGAPRPGTQYDEAFDRIEPVSGQRIPRLRDVIRLVKHASDGFHLVIEIKTPVLEARDQPWRRLVDAVLEMVEEEQFGDRIRLCSFDWGALVYAQQQRPATRTWFTTPPLSWYGPGDVPAEDIPPTPEHLGSLREQHGGRDAPWHAGYDPRGFAGGYPEAIAEAGGEAWFMYYRDCQPDRIQAAHSHALAVAAWSVNLRDASVVGDLAAAGVDIACLDYPEPREQ